MTSSLPEGVSGIGGLYMAASAHADTVGREEDVRDLLADFFRPRLSSTLHSPMVGTIRLKTNAESDRISFLV